MNPFEVLWTYSLLRYTEMAHGYLLSRRGFAKVNETEYLHDLPDNVQVLQALQRVGLRLGVTYRLNTPVRSILVPSKSEIRGVRLESGEELFACCRHQR